MKFFLKKFGTTLTSRQAGLEAYNAIRPLFSGIAPHEVIEIDFDDVVTFSPSWADEFLTRLKDQFGKRLVLLESNNPSVKATIELLESINTK